MLKYSTSFIMVLLALTSSSGIVPGINSVGYDIFSQLSKGNMIYSPLSVGQALHFLLLGADGSTKTQLQQLLLSSDETHEHISALIQSLTSDKENNRLQMTSKMFVGEDISLSPHFTNLAKQYLETVLHALDLQFPDAALALINSEIAKETNGKIQELLSKDMLTEDVKLVLVNIVYFKGAWDKPFKTYNTKDRSFYLTPDSYVNIPMMQQTSNLKYLETADFQSAVLGFKKAAVEFIVFKPKIDLDKLTGKILNHEDIEKICSSMMYEEIELRIPKMKVTHDIKLKDVLRQMGLTDIFDDKTADFSKITSSGDREVCVGEVVHSAYISVDEEGCEAAAATAAAMRFTRSAPFHQDPIALYLDTPFLYLLRDKQSGVVLFAGKQMSFEGELHVVKPDRTEL